MKFNNETKVGVLAIVAIVILVLGFNFLKGSSVFSKPTTFYAKFANIGSLEKSNPVKINGLTVGSVAEIKQADTEVDSIIIEIHLTRDIRIPSNAVAFIDGSVLGSAYISLEKPTATPASYLSSGDTLSTRLESGIIGNIQSQLAPTISRVNQTLDSLKIAIGAITSVFDPSTKNNMQTLIANLANSASYLQQLLNAQTGLLAKGINNLNSVTQNLAANNEVINSALKNFQATSAQLANSDIQGTLTDLRGTIGQLKTTVSSLNDRNGSLGLLMNDRELYDRLNRTAQKLTDVALSAEITFDDIRAHPKRYVNISVFGGKNKGAPLSSPLIKDTIPK